MPNRLVRILRDANSLKRMADEFKHLTPRDVRRPDVDRSGTRPRVFWVSHFLPYPAIGFGALQRTHHLVRQIAQRFEVHLFAVSDRTGEEQNILDMGVAHCHLSLQKSRPERLWAGVAGAIGPETYWERAFDHARLRDALRTAASGQSGVLLLDTLYLARYRDCAPHLPLVVTHHNIESDLTRQRATLRGGPSGAYLKRQGQLTVGLERRISRAAALNLMVSPDDDARLRRLAGDVATCIVPNGVDVDYFRPDPAATRSPYSLVFAGGMDWFPNREAIQWLASEIWPKLVAREPRRTLTVIGKAAPPEILALAARDSRVTVAGFVPDIRPYLARASAYICPIRIGGGTRLKVLDALATGVPLLATALSVEGLGLTDGEHFLKADSADAMVAQLDRLDANPGLGGALSTAGRAFVSADFSWDGIGERLATRLRDLR